ncbi:MAG: flagellar basal body protein [Planctomycetaceae bacterium]
MLQSIIAQTPLTMLRQVAKFTERRQEVLAGNIANIDTPGYRMRDLPAADFQAALRAAMQPSPNSGAWPQSPGVPWSLHPVESPGTMQPPPPELFPAQLFQARVEETQPGITFQDANNRSVEHQFLQMTKNSLMQQFALQLMSAQYGQLQAAISGQA